MSLAAAKAATELWQQVMGSGPDEAAKGLIIRFELDQVQDESKTDEEGRPVFIEKEFIEIRSPNDPFTVIKREVNAADRAMYPQAYRAWKLGAAEAITGTPLKEWAPIARSQAEYLTHKGIRSVEQFAEISDDACSHLGHGYLTLRNKAQAWLAKAKDASQVTKMAAELRQRDVKIESLEQQVRDLIAKFSKDDDSPAPKKSKASQQ